jgi:hypothetical protein
LHQKTHLHLLVVVLLDRYYPRYHHHTLLSDQRRLPARLRQNQGLLQTHFSFQISKQHTQVNQTGPDFTKCTQETTHLAEATQEQDHLVVDNLFSF